MGKPTRMRDAIDHISNLNTEIIDLRAKLEAAKWESLTCDSCRRKGTLTFQEAFIKVEAESARLRARLASRDERTGAMEAVIKRIAFIGTSGTGQSAEGKVASDFIASFQENSDG